MIKILSAILIYVACLLEISFISGSILSVRDDKYRPLLITIPQIIINVCAIYFLISNL